MSRPSETAESRPEARIRALADACVLCGLCLPHCPTYGLDRREAESPRGRIALFRALAEGQLEIGDTAADALDHCLSCRHCERVCPANVRYGDLLALGRAHQRVRRAPGWRQRALEAVVLRPRLLALALRFAALARRVPGLSTRLPPRARSVDRVPIPQPRNARGRVALFSGCLGPHHDAAPLQAATRVLVALGWDVCLAPDAVCCGALHRHAGADATAQTQAEINRHAFAAQDVCAVLTLASGCHEAVADALQPAGIPVEDVLGFVARDARLESLALRNVDPSRSAVALHLPCTQRNVVRSHADTARLLARIPGLRLQPLPEGGCCGAAGSHMLTFGTRAARLREPLLDALATSEAATLCSANVGCRLHLEAGLDARGAAARVLHPIELLAEHLG